MAFQYVETIINNRHIYEVRYDPETGQVNTTVVGNAPEDEPETPITPDAVAATFCNGTTLHVVKEQTAFPYIYATQVVDSPECGYIPVITPPPPPASPLNYGLIYRGTFSNTEQGRLEENNGGIEAVTILICDGNTLAEGVETQYVELETGQDPLHLSTIDNDESKFTPIRATQAIIQFISSNQISADTFVEGDDDRWFVQVIIREQIIFSGYLNTDETAEDFNAVYNNYVTLVATDKIGALKDVPLTDFDGNTPHYTPESGGKYKIIQFIAWALSKTGLQLEINLVDNLFEESFPNLPAFDNIYLSPKTFEGSEIATCEDCYTVLSKILGDEYFLKQWQNAFWICRIDEYEDRNFSYFRFNYKGEYIEQITDVDLKRSIGQNPDDEELWDIEHIEEATTKLYQRAFKEVREVYNYNYPKEIIDNQDFSRGGWLSPVIVPNKTVEGKSYNGQAYRFDDWATYKGTFGSTTPAQGTAYIMRYFFEDIEKERFLQLVSDTLDDQFIQSNPVPVHAMDRFDFSIDYRLSPKAAVLGTQTIFRIKVILKGDDGITYILVADWKDVILGTATTPVKWEVYSGQEGMRFYSSDASSDYFQSLQPAGDTPPFPVDGDLYILLPFSAQDYVDYQNLKFSYTPYINGGYAEYKGQQHSVSTVNGNRAVREQEVFISDSPKKLFKGAMYKKVDGKFVLTGKWYNGAVFPNPPETIYYNTRGRTQAFTVWNQHNRTFRILDSKLDGLQTTKDVQGRGLPDCAHLWVMEDVTPHTYNRRFLLLHYDMDFYLCSWTGYFSEVFSTDIPKDYASPYQFKYLRTA